MAEMKSRSQNYCMINLLLLFLLSASLSQFAAGQPSDSTQSDDQYNLDPSHVNPSYAVIVIVLVLVFFITGFISIYIHQCTDDSSTVVGNPVAASRIGNVRGIDKSIIETFPTFLYSEVKESKIGERSLECAICLNEFEEDETLRLLPRCDHVFHSECIDAWLAGHSSCPVCRANLAAEPIQIGTFAESTNQLDSNAEEESPSEVRIEIGTEEGNAKTNRKLPRSHSTGHSLSRPVDDSERFTLKLPVEVRRQLLARTKLKRATSLLALPRTSSSRRGYRGEGSGSSRYGRMLGRSISRVVSFRWPIKGRVDGEGSTKRGLGTAVTPLDGVLSV